MMTSAVMTVIAAAVTLIHSSVTAAPILTDAVYITASILNTGSVLITGSIGAG